MNTIRRRAVGALVLATVGATALAAFHGAVDARIAQLAGETTSPPRPPLRAVLASLTGLVLVISLAMCLPPALRFG